REVSVVMTPEVKVNDYVIVHAGFAIQILDQAEAEENLKTLQRMAEAVEGVRSRVRQTKAVQERRKHGARRNPGPKV
ncbi:MAG: HypC/HybG/HupF family hydrogenase formation chaperone, partial [candidate division WOR-3 bacterium]